MTEVLALPDVGWSEYTFEPNRPAATDYMDGRRTETQFTGTPWWTMSATAISQRARGLGQLDSFMMKATSGDVFVGYDVSRPRPIRMDKDVPLAGTKAGGGAFDGTATLQSITNTRTLVVGGLPALFLLSEGDYLEVRKSALVRSLHRITADVVASASGVATVPIRFGLDTQNFTAANSIVNFEKAGCIMQMDPGSFQGGRSWSNMRPSFSASEVFYS